MVLRSMFGGIAKRNMVNNKHSSGKTNDGSKVRVESSDFEDLSKLLKLVAANEGVLEGKKSATMEELVRAIQRTIDQLDKSASDNQDRSNGLSDLLIN